MTCVLETDIGRFEAETPEAAVRLSKAAQRQHAAEERRREKARDLARERAMVNGFAVYDRKAEGKEFPCGWMYYQVGTPHVAVRVEPVEDRDWLTCVTVDTEWGMGSIELLERYHAIHGVVENGAGHVMILFLVDPTLQEQGQLAWAVGCADGELAFAMLHGIKSSMFTQSRHNI